MKWRMMFLKLEISKNDSACATPVAFEMGVLEFEGPADAYLRLQRGESLKIGEYKITPFTTEQPSTLLAESPLKISCNILTM